MRNIEYQIIYINILFKVCKNDIAIILGKVKIILESCEKVVIIKEVYKIYTRILVIRQISDC